MIDDSFRARFRSIPLAIYDLDISSVTYDSEITSGQHNHQEFEILLIIEGELLININNNPVVARSGDLVFVPPYAVHSITFGPRRIVRHRCICFNVSMLDNVELAKQLEENLMCVSPLILSTHPLANQFASTILLIRQSYIDQQTGWEMVAKGQLMTLFGLLWSSGLIQKTEKSSRENRFCREVSKYIETHYARELSSNEVAKMLSYDHSYFCRLFKKNFGSSFSSYLSMYRIYVARELFDKGNKSVSFVANVVGFNNISYFSKLFQFHIGCLPLKYIKSNVESYRDLSTG